MGRWSLKEMRITLSAQVAALCLVVVILAGCGGGAEPSTPAAAVPSSSVTPPRGLAPDPGAFSVLTKTLPDATTGRTYRYTLQAGGGKPPYLWAVSSGSLPLGFVLSSEGEVSGLLSGVVETDYPFTVRVVDAASPSSEILQLLNIRVRAGNLGRNDEPRSATPISDGVIRASISPHGDIDVYSFRGISGGRVTIEIRTNQDTHFDSFLELLDQDGVRLAHHDDIEPGGLSDSRIEEYVLPGTGTYYVRISDARGGGRPDFIYELHLTLTN